MTNVEIKKILDTLPIGYYTGCPVNVTMNDKADISYYDPTENAITISTRIINRGLANYPADYDKETAVRSMLYHEVSHAILTPYVDITDIFNVFEDERIETLLADYYIGVNFKEQVYAINGGCVHTPTCAWEDFYNIVRFRKGLPSELEAVEKIINDYADIDSHSSPYSYDNAVTNFYNSIRKKWHESGYDPHMKYNWHNRAPSVGGKGEPMPSNENSKDEFNSDTEKLNEKIISSRRGGREHMKHIFQSICDGIDQGLEDEIRQIFNSYKSRQLNNGRATNGYSGIFDYRSVIRDDYKYFIRPSSKGSGQGFSKFNLNLFIDVSGSYRNNVNRTNCLIRALETIEKELPMFSFNVITMEVGEEILPKTNRYIKAKGDNQLDSKLINIYRDVQRGDAVNYNIVLFDGWTAGGEFFTAFNHNNVSIISDTDNQREFDEYAPNAKKQFIDNSDRSYADLLTDKVCDILRVAFC